VSATGEQHVLGAAFIDDADTARACWRRWRAEADIEALDFETISTIPLLNGRFENWIEDDPQKPLLLGISKREWSRNHIHFRILERAVEVLRRAGIEPTLTGAAGSALSAPGRGIFPISGLELLIPRDRVSEALHELRDSGWQAPEGPRFGVASSVNLTNAQGDQCLIRWRLLTDPPEVSCEARAMTHATAHWQGSTFSIPSPAWQLADALRRSREPFSTAAALIALKCPVDWQEFRRAIEYRGVDEQIVARLEYLRGFAGFGIPPLQMHKPSKLRGIYRDYKRSKQQLGTQTFRTYLRLRWDVASTAELAPSLGRILQSEARRVGVSLGLR